MTKCYSKLGLYATAAMMCMTTACTDQESIVPEGYEQISITGVSQSLSATRTQIDDTETEDGATNILWSVGDQLGVFGESTSNACFSTDITTAAASATFSGTMTSGDTPLYAYYPYNENATSKTAVPVTIAGDQYYSDLTSISGVDIKVSNSLEKQDDGSYKFSFTSKVALLHFTVNIENVTGLSTDETLEAIHVELPEGTSTDALDPWCGDFTMDVTSTTSGLTPSTAEDASTSYGLVVNMSESPTLSETVTAYAAIAPAITTGQKLQIYIETNKHWISFTVTSLVDMAANTCYDIPLYLANSTEDNNLTIENLETSPTIESFSFTVSANEGSILATDIYYNGSSTTYRTITEQTLTVDNDENTISGCIPYLYNFTLVPTFTLSDEDATVTANGSEVTSGKTSVDFSDDVTLTVTSANGTASTKYTVSVTNTGLPVVVLKGNSGGTVSFLHTKVPAKTADWGETDVISIYDKEDSSNNIENQTCGFRLRGNSTSTFPKKPLAIKLTKKKEILGMASHKRWCLLANWIDRSMIRNAVAFNLAQIFQNHFTGEAGTDNESGKGLIWNPSGKNVELVIDGAYVGNYLLCEQIKIGSNRLDIQDVYEDVLETNSSPTYADCGYLLEFDDNYDETYKFLTSHRTLPCMAKDDKLSDDIWSYVKNWVQGVEDKLTNSQYTAAYDSIDINSVIDYWFVMELTMNNEYHHPKSVYMYKDGTGKLCAGPVWDFDYQTFPNIDKVNSNTTMNNSGSNKISYTSSTLLYTLSKVVSQSSVSDSDAPYMWYPLLFNDDTFKTRVKTRWNSVYSSLSGLLNTIQTLGEENAVSDTYNQAMWPTLNDERTSYSWFIEYSGDEDITDYDDVISNLKEVYQERLTNMDTAINGL